MLTQREGEDAMGKIVITEFLSLDGVVEDPGRIGGFKHAGWTFEINRGEDGDEYKLRELLGAEALLLGRITYEEFAAFWPYLADRVRSDRWYEGRPRDGDYADRFNSLPKYVVSSTLEDPEWNNSRVLEGDVVEAVSRLKRELDGEILVHGSIQLARALIEHDLADELRLMVYPVILGAGERLFGELSDKKPLRLMGTRTVGDGVVIHTYEPVRNPDHGEEQGPEMIGAARS
jgi:dihydrofolate reductase